MRCTQILKHVSLEDAALHYGLMAESNKQSCQQCCSTEQHSTAQLEHSRSCSHSTAQHSKSTARARAQQEHSTSTAQTQQRDPISPVPWLVSELKSPFDSCHIIRQQAEGCVSLHQVGLRNASLGPGGQQIAPQDLWPGEAVLVDHPGPPPGPALTRTLFTHLCNQEGVGEGVW